MKFLVQTIPNSQTFELLNCKDYMEWSHVPMIIRMTDMDKFNKEKIRHN